MAENDEIQPHSPTWRVVRTLLEDEQRRALQAMATQYLPLPETEAARAIYNLTARLLEKGKRKE